MALDLFKLLGTIEVDNSKANKALDDTSNKGQQTQSKLSKAFGAVGKGAAVVGKTVVTGLAAGGAAFAGLTAKALSASGELEQNMGGSEAVFKEYAGKMQNTAKNAFSQMGLSTSDYLATANKMGALFQGAGFSIEESMNLSSGAMQRAADVASIMGIDTGAAMEAIAGAAKGNFTMMDNLGVAMNDTTLQAYALSKGIYKSTSEMTNQEKIGLAMEMFMDKTAYATGNYAKENETLAGALGTAKAALTNFLDGSGGVDALVASFDNLAQAAIKSLNEIVPRLTSALPALIQSIMPMIPSLVESVLPGVVEGAVALLVGLAQMLPDLAVVLLEQIPVIIGQIRSTLESQFPQLAEPFAVIEGLFSGVWQAMQIVWEGVGKPIFDALSIAFSSAKEAIQPLIDSFSNYVTEGGFATDATAIATSAVDFLKTAYSDLCTFVDNVVTGFQNVVTWCKENETALQMVAIAVGTLTTAIVAYNIAQAIKNAGGIVELAQLAGLAIGLGALTVAEAAHTAATWLATAATTAWGTAVAFLTSPITLVIAAIGALIAVVVLCVKHWDKIKEAGAKAWEWIKSAWSSAGAWFSGVWKGIQNAFANVGSWFSEKFSAAKQSVQSAWSSITGFFSNIKTGIVNAFSNVKEKLSEPFEKARDAIKGVVDKIKGFFSGLKLSLPNIKLPHFSISGKLSLAPPSVPKMSIDWYAKAMNNPMIMNDPTIFGYNPATGSFMGGGEAGSEVVSGTNTLMNMIQGAVAAQNETLVYYLQMLIELLADYFPQVIESAGHDIVTNDGVIIARYAPMFDTALGKISRGKDRGR